MAASGKLAVAMRVALRGRMEVECLATQGEPDAAPAIEEKASHGF